MIEAPTPILPRGAGGPLERAAGRVSPASPVAIVRDHDPLTRILALEAVTALGFVVLGEGSPDRVGEALDGLVRPSRTGAVFVSLDTPDGCFSCAAHRGTVVNGEASHGGGLLVGYGTGPVELLAAHRLHRCTDLVLALSAVAGRPRLLHLPCGDRLARAGVTPREADVLVLLMAGLVTAEIARRLCVSRSTARSHCRAVLRKLGAGDRRALRARILAGPEPRLTSPVSGAERRFV